MKLTPSQLNKFSMVKLPSAWFCGVRVVAINDTSCTTTVKHRWINQNPFNSMFWAVQGMAAELATGAIVIGKIKKEQAKISMLVANNKANFSKKANRQEIIVVTLIYLLFFISCYYNNIFNFKLTQKIKLTL